MQCQTRGLIPSTYMVCSSIHVVLSMPMLRCPLCAVLPNPALSALSVTADVWPQQLQGPTVSSCELPMLICMLEVSKHS